jgi:hypothetical protein
MRKSVFVLAVIGAACSSVAFAGEVKKDNAHAPVVKATTMSDADMDKVTAGFSSDNNGANGGGTGFSGNDKGRGAAMSNAHGRF